MLSINDLDLNDLIEADYLSQASAQEASTSINPTSQEALTTSTTSVAISPSEQRVIAVRISIEKPFAEASSATVYIFSIDAPYRPEHIDAQNVLTFVSVRIKKYYDVKHIFIFFKIEEYVYLRLHRDYQIIDMQSRKLD